MATKLMEQREALARQLAEMDARIAEEGQKERTDALLKTKELIVTHGFTSTELFDTGKKRSSKSTGKSKLAGVPLKPKYTNTATGDTWSGRGLQPRWLKAALTVGKKLEDFAV